MGIYVLWNKQQKRERKIYKLLYGDNVCNILANVLAVDAEL